MMKSNVFSKYSKFMQRFRDIQEILIWNLYAIMFVNKVKINSGILKFKLMIEDY